MPWPPRRREGFRIDRLIVDPGACRQFAQTEPAFEVCFALLTGFAQSPRCFGSNNSMIAVLTGLIAGAVHVVSGPDHLTAVAPLAVQRPRRAWLPGVRWGLGHSAGVALVGLLSLWLRDLIPVDLLSTWGERLVGVMLFGIGWWALRRALKHRELPEPGPSNSPSPITSIPRTTANSCNSAPCCRGIETRLSPGRSRDSRRRLESAHALHDGLGP